MTLTNLLRLCALAMLLLLSAACRQEQKLSASGIALEIAASELTVGDTVLTVRVRDKQGNPLTEPGTLSLRGDMDHAGMIPVLAEADSAVDGVFNVPFEWTMGGSWIVEASLALSADEVARQEFHFDIASASDEQDMTHADHGAMDDMAMAGGASGANSAAYMRITNRSSEDIVLVSAASEVAGAVEFHETRVVDGAASMTRLDALVVPGNGKIELVPGGRHLMLMNLKQDLQRDDNFVLDLTDGLGQLYRLEFLVSEPPASDLGDNVEVGGLVISNRWARPASAG